VIQQILVVLIVLACAGWLGVQAYRFFRPRPGGKLCGGNCCDGEEKPLAAAGREQVTMISSDDLRARIKARQG
jgi:hypothetical protein